MFDVLGWTKLLLPSHKAVPPVPSSLSHGDMQVGGVQPVGFNLVYL